MILTASRPGRKIHIEERSTAGGKWYGLYIYSVPVEASTSCGA